MKNLFIIGLTVLSISFFVTNEVSAQVATTSTTLGAPSQAQTNPTHTNLSPSILYRVLYEAQSIFNTPFQTLLSEYYSKQCKINCISILPNGQMIFRVERTSGGLGIITIMTDL